MSAIATGERGYYPKQTWIKNDGVSLRLVDRKDSIMDTDIVKIEKQLTMLKIRVQIWTTSQAIIQVQ